jgi:hypothetical protein
VLACAACLSPGGPIALERGNFDLPEFVLIAAAGLFALRQGVTRFASYAIFLIIGLLKFYPLYSWRCRSTSGLALLRR